MLTRQDAMAFAQQWAANWNRLAIDTIVNHFAPEGEMRSPLATKLAGSSTIKGRDAIRTYWHAAYGGLSEPHLTLERAAARWTDPGVRDDGFRCRSPDRPQRSLLRRRQLGRRRAARLMRPHAFR